MGFSLLGSALRMAFANPATVGLSKMSRKCNRTPQTWRKREMTCVARSESPPNAKKSSAELISEFPSTSLQASTIACSSKVCPIAVSSVPGSEEPLSWRMARAIDCASASRVAISRISSERARSTGFASAACSWSPTALAATCEVARI